MSSTLPVRAAAGDLAASAVLRRIAVPQRRLDELDALRQRPWRRLFVKIDVQGAEPAVLAGMDGLWERVQGLQLEMALVPLYEGERPWLDVIAGLASRGFAPYLLFPATSRGPWAARSSSTPCSTVQETLPPPPRTGDAGRPVKLGSRTMAAPGTLSSVLFPVHRAGWPFVAAFLAAAVLLGLLWGRCSGSA